MVSEGDVVLAELPQADGQFKQRPILLLRKLPGYGDFLVCGISSQLHQEEAGFDIVLRTGDKEFAATGLKVSSVIRLNFLAVTPVSRMKRYLGKVHSEILETLRSNLATHLVAGHKGF
jgi:mRNA interferase MazF